MIDVHSHILYGIDDGPKTLQESIEMARAAVASGIHTIVATPHHQNGTYINEKETILHHVKILNEQLKQHDIPLTVLSGQEVRVYGGLLEDYEAGKLLTINGTNQYMLIEFPSNHVPRYVESLLFQMQLEDVLPIIAHPERNAEIIENPNLLYNLVKKGALVQLTAASIAGDFGKKIKKFSLQLIKHNMAHLIASDAHNVTNRSFKVNESYKVIEKEFGQKRIYQFQEAAYAVIGGQYVEKDMPERIRTKKLFGIF